MNPKADLILRESIKHELESALNPSLKPEEHGRFALWTPRVETVIYRDYSRLRYRVAFFVS